MSKRSKSRKRPGEPGRIAQKDRIKTWRDRVPGLCAPGSQRPARKDRKPGHPVFSPRALYICYRSGLLLVALIAYAGCYVDSCYSACCGPTPSPDPRGGSDSSGGSSAGGKGSYATAIGIGVLRLLFAAGWAYYLYRRQDLTDNYHHPLPQDHKSGYNELTERSSTSMRQQHEFQTPTAPPRACDSDIRTQQPACDGSSAVRVLGSRASTPDASCIST
jgi:hypothetical protein